MSRITSAFICLFVVTLSVVANGEEKKKPPKVTFDDHVKEVFRQKCASCHNPDKKSGDLDLTTYSGVMAGGGSGEVVEAGDSGASYLYSLITHDSEPFMPPESPKIADAMIETVRKWIDGGLLENKGSKAIASNKPKFEMALQKPSTERPEVAPMPPRLSLQPVVATPRSTAIASLATNPWSSLAAVTGQKQILLYNTKTMELVGALPFPEGFPQVLKFSRNGSLLLAGGGLGGAMGKVVVWDVRRGDRVMEIGSQLDAVLGADISSDHGLIALGGPQRIVRIYATETGQLIHELRKHTDWIYSLEFSPDSVLLATGDRNGGLHVWEAYTGREYLTLKAHTKAVSDISWRSDSNVVASASEDGSVRLWEMENGGQVRNWGAHGGGVASIEFTRDGRVVSAGRDRLVKLWDQAGKQQRAFEAFGDLALEATYCDETNSVIAGDWSGEIRVWNSADGKRLGQLLAAPPTLESRLAEAQKADAAAKAAMKPLVDAAAKSGDAAMKSGVALVTEPNRLRAVFAEKAVAESAIRKVTAAMTTMTAEKKAADVVLAKLKPSVPQLTDAVAKAQQAAATLKEDKQLATLAAQLKTSLDKHAAELKTKTALSAAKATALAAAQAEMKKQQGVVTAAAAKEVAMTKQIAAMKTQSEALKKKAATDAAAASAATAKANAAAQLVAKWQDEIKFAKHLAELTAKQTAAQDALNALLEETGDLKTTSDAQTAVVNTAKAALAGIQKQVAAQQAKLDALQETHASYVAAQKTATSGHDQAKAIAAKTQPVIQSLQTAIAAAKQAVAQSGNDKTVAAALASLTTALSAKQKEMQDATQLAAAKKKEIDLATANMVKATAEMKTMTVAMTATKAKADTQMKTMTTEQAKLTAAAKALQDASAKVSAAEATLQKVRLEIAQAKGLAPPAS